MSEIHSKQTLEDRLQPWIDQAEYIIALTVIIMAWSAGWVDLLAFESFSGIIFGRYSPPFFAAFIVYSFGFIFWFWLIISLSALEKFKATIAFFQRNPLLFLLFVLLFSAISWSTIYIRYWVVVPLLQGTVLIIFSIFILLVLFAKPEQDGKMQLWRKVTNTALLAFIAIEIILHILAFIGISRLQNTSGLFEPYSLIYQNEEGHTYGQTNQYGWYYPTFEIDTENENVILVGDTFVQALQVSHNEHMGVKLQEQLGENFQIMPTGSMGYGASSYINTTLYQFMWDDLEPDEIVLFIHLANDFQYVTEPNSERPFFQVAEEGKVSPHPNDEVYAHVYEHVYFDGHQPPALLESLFTYSFLISALGDTIGSYTTPPANELHAVEQDYAREIIPVYRVDMPIEARSEALPFGLNSFMFSTEANEQADIAYDVMFGRIRTFVNFMAQRDITVRIITIPFFPETFYTQSGSDWDTEFDSYDILLPEQNLQTFAEENDIPFIATGSIMQARGMSVEDIQTLFYANGLGHLTSEGHQFFADLLYDCFYGEVSTDDC